jgi:hypothetical protein
MSSSQTTTITRTSLNNFLSHLAKHVGKPSDILTTSPFQDADGFDSVLLNDVDLVSMKSRAAAYTFDSTFAKNIISYSTDSGDSVSVNTYSISANASGPMVGSSGASDFMVLIIRKKGDSEAHRYVLRRSKIYSDKINVETGDLVTRANTSFTGNGIEVIVRNWSYDQGNNLISRLRIDIMLIGGKDITQSFELPVDNEGIYFMKNQILSPADMIFIEPACARNKCHMTMEDYILLLDAKLGTLNSEY